MNNQLPETGTAMKCLLCAFIKPWGVFDSTTGAAVCKDCQNAVQGNLSPPDGCYLVAHDTGDGWSLEVADSGNHTIAYLTWPKQWEGKELPARELFEAGFKIVPAPTQEQLNEHYRSIAEPYDGVL